MHSVVKQKDPSVTFDVASRSVIQRKHRLADHNEKKNASKYPEKNGKFVYLHSEKNALQ